MARIVKESFVEVVISCVICDGRLLRLSLRGAERRDFDSPFHIWTLGTIRSNFRSACCDLER